MKRSPLNRKQPLRATSKNLRSSGGLARGGSTLARSGPLRKRSEKTAKIYREERVPLVISMLEQYPVCYVCTHFSDIPGGTWWAEDLHEILTRGRTGGVRSREWLDPDNIITVCRPHHTWIDDHKREATELGLLSNDYHRKEASPPTEQDER